MKHEEDCLCEMYEIEANPDLKPIRHMFPEREHMVKQDLEYYIAKIKEWEYCYCADCKKIIFNIDLLATADGIRCSKCKGYNLESPGWVNCPHHKESMVKCPRSGKGIRKLKYESVCNDNCNFRVF